MLPDPVAMTVYDDDPEECDRRVSRIRKLTDHTVMPCPGREALYQAAAAPPRGAQSVLALVDLALQGGDVDLSGWLIIDTLHRHPALQRCAAVVLSSRVNSRLVEHARLFGACGYISWGWLRDSSRSSAEVEQVITELKHSAYDQSHYLVRSLDPIDPELDAQLYASHFEDAFPGLTFSWPRLEAVWWIAHGLTPIDVNRGGGTYGEIVAHGTRGEGELSRRPPMSLCRELLNHLNLSPYDRVLKLHNFKQPWSMRRQMYDRSTVFGRHLDGTENDAFLDRLELDGLRATLAELSPEPPDSKEMRQTQLRSAIAKTVHSLEFADYDEAETTVVRASHKLFDLDQEHWRHGMLARQRR